MKLLLLLSFIANSFLPPNRHDTLVPLAIPKTAMPEDLTAQAKKDARMFYKGYKAPRTAVIITTALFNFYGIIPATVISLSKKINPESLGCPYPALMKNTTYRDAYMLEAKKIRSRKAWAGFGIVMGILVVVAIPVLLIVAGMTRKK